MPREDELYQMEPETPLADPASTAGVPASGAAYDDDLSLDSEVVVKDAEPRTVAEVYRLPTPEEIDAEASDYRDDWRDATMDRELRPFMQGVVSFLFEPGTAARWFYYSAAGACVTFLLHRALTSYLASGGSAATVLWLGALVVCSVLTLIVVLPIAVACLRIIVDTANGHDRIVNWPNLVILEWGMEALYLIVAVGLAAAPGGIVTTLAINGAIAKQAAFAPILLSVWLLLPYILLSMLDEGTIIAIVSPRVVTTILKGADGLLIYYVQTALVMGGLFLASLGYFSDQPLLPPIATAVAVPLAMIYSRLLGRLMWVSELRRFHAEEAKEQTNSSSATTPHGSDAPSDIA